jgi:hypothetical protein
MMIPRGAAVVTLLLSATGAFAQPVSQGEPSPPESCEIRVSDEAYRPGLQEWCDSGFVSQVSAVFLADAVLFQVALSRRAQARWAELAEKVVELFRDSAVRAARERKIDTTLVLRDYDAKPLITCSASPGSPEAASCISAGAAALSDAGCRVLVTEDSLRPASALWCDTGFFREIQARTDATFGNVMTVLARFSATGQARWLEDGEGVFTRVREGFAQLQRRAAGGTVNVMLVFYANDTGAALGRCAQLPAQKEPVCELAPSSPK